MNNIQYLLREINLIREKYLIQQDNKEQFNVFTTLMNGSDEVCLHSRFISSLLDPKSPSKLGLLPLNLFLKTIGSELNFSDMVEVTPNNSDWCEHKEIDILISDRVNNCAVIIENKINARDSNHEDRGQIEGYYQTILDEGFPENNIEVYYLTTDGHEPSKESLYTTKSHPELFDKLVCIDYTNDITPWLQNLAKEVYDKPYLRETINQYINLIKDMTGDIDIEERKELAALVGKSEDNLQSAHLLIENFCHICWHTLADFRDDLINKFNSEHIELLEYPDNDAITDIIHGSIIKRKKVVFNFTIKDKSDFEWVLGSNYDDDGGFYIGMLKESNKSIQEATKISIKDFATKHGYCNDNDTDWFFWNYISNIKDNPYIYVWDFISSGYDTYKLINTTFRKDTSALFVKEVRHQMSLLTEYIKNHSDE